jgi:hypothetical protein
MIRVLYVMEVVGYGLTLYFTSRLIIQRKLTYIRFLFDFIQQNDKLQDSFFHLRRLFCSHNANLIHHHVDCKTSVPFNVHVIEPPVTEVYSPYLAHR